jgi:anti-sigma-K factor RskA
VRLGGHRRLDAVCGEYLVGTLRGAARRRFERALAEEPIVARRLQYWERFFSAKYSEDFAVQPSAAIWRRIRRDLGLSRYAPPWHARIWLWRIWAAAATVALALVVVLPLLQQPTYSTVAILTGGAPQARVTAELSRDRKSLRLLAARPVAASPTQSFELWVIPAGGGAPVSLAVMGELDTRIDLGLSQTTRLTRGAKLAISVEPAGGSPTGAPTGPVILVGDIVS